MKTKVFLVFFLLYSNNIIAQQQLSQNMQKAFDVCWALRTAISSGNTASLKSANEEFKKCNLRPFSSLRPQESDTTSLNGHFVWDEVFVDSLIDGRDVRAFAQRYAERRTQRGATETRGGTVLIKSCAVKGKGKARFTFVSEKHQEIAVIAEPQGKLTLRIHTDRTGKWHNDDQDVKRGRESRIHVFDLPEGVKDTIEIEVINCKDEDISFVILSN